MNPVNSFPLVQKPPKPKKGEAVAVAVLLASALVSAGSGLSGAAAAGAAAESVVAQSVQARVTSSKNATRRGQYSEAWRRMGLRAIRREIRRELECALHSYGQVQEFFLRTPCRSLQRRLLVIGDGQGNTIVVSIAWVRMRNAVTGQPDTEVLDGAAQVAVVFPSP